MKLLPLDAPGILELAASWLARKENHQWLDFGNGRQPVTPTLLKIMAQRETHFLRVYTLDGDDTPLGIAGLNSVDRDDESRLRHEVLDTINLALTRVNGAGLGEARESVLISSVRRLLSG